MCFQTRLWRRSPAPAVAAILIAGLATASAASREDPFVFFESLVKLTQADRARIADGDVAVRVLPGSDGHLGLFTALRVEASSDRLVEWVREIEAFKQSRFVVAVRRFSDPPVPADLDGLVLDSGDVDMIRHCRSGSCGLKLAAHEIDALRQAMENGPRPDERVQSEFRRIVFERILAYRSGGLGALPPVVDRSDPSAASEALAAVLGESSYLTGQLPAIAARLRGEPAANASVLESFIYWSKEQYGAGKPVIAVTHVDIVRPNAPPAPSVLVLSREVLATHYRKASLGVTAIVEDSSRSERYLVYVNQTQVDLLGGLFGGLKRRLIESRLAGDSAKVMRLVRARLEGVPPGTTDGS